MPNDVFTSDTDHDVFGGDFVPTIDPDKDYFSELVGEGKKYKDPQAAGRAIAEKDAFIAKLLSETKGMRETITKQKTMEDLLDQIAARGTTERKVDNPLTNEDQTKPLTPEQLSRLVQEELEKRTTKSQLETNYNTVVNTLREKFGDNANRVIAEKANELGVDINFLKQLATEKPKVFLTMIGEAKGREEDFFSGPTRSTVVPDRLKEKNQFTGERNQSYYDTIKAKNKSHYWSQEVQSQMHKDAIRLGERFFT